MSIKLPKNVSGIQKFIEIKEIKNGVAIMNDNSMKAVCACSSINFDLLSQTEQEALVARFQEFLNALDFPIQIIVASRHFRIDDYLNQIKELEKTQTNELLRIQTSEYINFVQSFVEFANIMSKSFYVVVPFSIIESKQEGFFEKVKNIISSTQSSRQKFEIEKFNQYKTQLEQRVSMILNGLQGLGIKTIPLNDEQLTQLYFEFYNVER